MIRLGLCCIFRDEPIRFRTTTAAALGRRPAASRQAILAELCRHNAEALGSALAFCVAHGIGCFRVNSRILPLRTHPGVGYCLDDLPGGADIRGRFEDCGRYARAHGLRLTFHPDQFVLLSSPDPRVHQASLEELDYHAEVAEWIGADVITIHAGGVYGDAGAALKRLTGSLAALPDPVRTRLGLENDDRLYAPRDLLPVCAATGVPLVYDAHHHRCLPDGMTIEEATARAVETWAGREPLFHISSPLDRADPAVCRLHHDALDPADIPACWLELDLTVEVEAKAKECAVLPLLAHLQARGVALRLPE